jgi:hypothetical protein
MLNIKICIIQAVMQIFYDSNSEEIFRITCSSADRGSQRGALPE